MKTLNKVGLEGTYLTIVNTVYEKSTANIILYSQEQNRDVHSYHFNLA